MRRTVRWVTPEIDAGPIIGQAIVPVLDDDTEASLSARILKAEHRLYPLVIDSLAGGVSRG
jgi:folate-dependent phosphoribosylglycinamide formyltransferase PurN